MPKGPIRRAHLISPFGIGAMVVVRDGTSIMTAGLDHWYEREDGETDSRDIDKEEYKFDEWRLQHLLGVSHFRLPPDYRSRRRAGETTPNCLITVPFVRFPKWHVCPKCYTMKELSLFHKGKQKCDVCQKNKRTRFVLQVPFVAVCDHGHIQDFPWREWVHKSAKPVCNQPMTLSATGGASLAAQKVKCKCGVERTLSRITEANPSDGGTFLSRNLVENGPPFLCTGIRPWLGTDEPTQCGQPLRGSLRSAANVYYADVHSAIYIPRSTSAAPAELIELLEEPPLSTLLKVLKDANADVNPEFLRAQKRLLLEPYSDVELEAALEVQQNPDQATGDAVPIIADDDPRTAFRRAEYGVLQVRRDEPRLKIEPADLSDYGPVIKYFDQMMLIHKLRETRAFAGFTRLRTTRPQPLDEQKAMLRRTPFPPQQSWLPAYIVHGEGIFLVFNEDRLQDWERQRSVVERANRLTNLYVSGLRTHALDRALTPRYLLVHTLAHLVINEFTFECGYSSAALRERLFVSDNPDAPMAAVLIYTAAGDAEGTLGGLVRMGKPGYFEPILLRSLERARWCSADPVCMELGEQGGQGPQSCNLAACHNCALLPETACEEFNRFLDRAMVIGSAVSNTRGFFSTP